MISKNKLYLLSIAVGAFAALTACSDNGGESPTPDSSLPAEYYSGGQLGTTFNNTASCFEQFTPAIENAGLVASFKRGERRFETAHAAGEQDGLTYDGLGPLYCRTGCIACHPGYGHGNRITKYNAEERGNGCLIIVTDRDGNIATSLGLVPMTVALPPFKPMIDEKQIDIKWLTYNDEWGNRFPDGETYDLIYPEVTIPESAFYSPLSINGTPLALSDAQITLESTIGLYGVGLLDAISDADLKAQYQAESKYVSLNPTLWNGSDWASTDADGHPYRFDYACDVTKLQANVSLWEVTNVVTPMFRYLYIPEEYAVTASDDPDVQASFYSYYPEWNKTGNVKTDIYNYLTSTEQKVEMDADASYDLMVWFRGLAVPAARDVDTDEFKRGKELFTEIGCATCHRPSWTTGEDVVVDTYGLTNGGAKAMPRYPRQTIWPYTDMVQHRLMMKNDIRTGWCRTTPLWGRGLMAKATGHSDRLHDCRARNVIEAIMWHGAANGDARNTVEKFRQLSKTDRDAVVKFINSI